MIAAAAARARKCTLDLLLLLRRRRGGDCDSSAVVPFWEPRDDARSCTGVGVEDGDGDGAGERAGDGEAEVRRTRGGARPGLVVMGLSLRLRREGEPGDMKDEDEAASLALDPKFRKRDAGPEVEARPRRPLSAGLIERRLLVAVGQYSRIETVCWGVIREALEWPFTVAVAQGPWDVDKEG